MAGANTNWNRWIYASVAKHLKAKAAAASPALPIIVDILDNAGATWKKAVTKAQATINGPKIRRQSGGEFRIWVDIFVAVTSKRAGLATYYDHIAHTGTVSNMLSECIEVKDYGDTGLLLIGELRLRTEESESVDVTHLNRREDDDEIFSTISARLLGHFTE